MIPTANSERNTTAKRRRVIVAVVVVLIILLLLSCCWVSFWPLDESADPSEENIERARSSGGVSVRDVRATAEPEVFVGAKGQAWLVTMALSSETHRLLLPGLFALDIDGVIVPPLMNGDAEIGGVQIVPDLIQPGETERISLVFAVPRATTEATLVVQFNDMSHDRRILEPLSLNSGEPE